jgi:cation:H+ antiporter
MWTGALLFVVGVALVLLGADWFTDSVVRAAVVFRISPFFLGVVLSGFEPENLATGVAAAASGLPQIALGTVIGATIVLLTGGLGVTLLLVPMPVDLPRAAVLGVGVAVLAFSVALWNDGTVSRGEGVFLVVVAVAVLSWLYRRSAVPIGGETITEADRRAARPLRTVALLAVGISTIVVGAELVVQGASRLITSLGVSETFFGMTVVAAAESVEEAGRMLVPARRGHSDLAWGNVVGTTIMLLAFNLGVLALVRPLVADPLVLRLHAPYLLGCVLLVAAALLFRARLGRRMGAVLLLLSLVYVALNVRYLRVA